MEDAGGQVEMLRPGLRCVRYRGPCLDAAAGFKMCKMPGARLRCCGWV